MANNSTIKLPKLPYGEGSMSIRPDGTIMYRKRIGNPKHEHAVYGKTAKECMDKMREAEKESIKLCKQSDTQILYDEMLNWLQTTKKPTLKPQSYKRLESVIRNQIKESNIAYLRYKSITSKEIQGVIDKLNNDNYSHSTIKKTYDTLSNFYSHVSVRDKFDNPMLLVSMLTQDNVNAETKQMEFFEQDDIDKFIAECSARYNTGNLKYKYGYILAANIYLGMRAGELLALQWKDIDFENKTIYVCKTLIEAENPKYDKDNVKLMKEKGIKRTLFTIQNSTKKSKNRYVPINNKAKELLLLHKVNSEFIEPNDYVISTRNRKTTSIKNLSDTIKSIQKNAETKVQSSNTHILRHTCASLYFRKGVPTITIAQILGHSKEVCEKTYIHFIEEQLKEAASKIDVIEI